MPEKRNIGRITNRKIATKDASFSVCAPQAAIGAAYATPTSTVTGMARTASGEIELSKNGIRIAMTTRYTVAVMSMRAAMNAWCPRTMSPIRSGVASIAWYCRLHLIAESTGQLASNEASCIAVAASRPGATNSR